MNIPAEHKGKFFYHFTHIDNIESVIHNGLLATNLKNERNIPHYNVAIENIQTRRSEMQINVGPRGVVHDYVPFYFASTNKMLLGLLNRKIVDQPLVVFIAISIEKILENNVIFTNASANTTIPPQFYENADDLNKLNWELINSTKWGEDSADDLHSRMAEVLIHKSVPLDWIDSFIVFNDICKEKIELSLKNAGLSKPSIQYQPFHYRYLFYTKFFFKDRKNETLVTGPLKLNEMYNYAVDYIIENRKIMHSNVKFRDIDDAVTKINNNFCVIPELKGIYNLETENAMHSQTVSEHTLAVVANVEQSAFYNYLNLEEKSIVKLAAFFHDIGKGPREKWSGGKQKAYADHPMDSLCMIIRILIEEFQIITDSEIRNICLLVAYHDLLGDIIYTGRSKQELFNLGISRENFYMLAALSDADIKAINLIWHLGYSDKLNMLLNEIMR